MAKTSLASGSGWHLEFGNITRPQGFCALATEAGIHGARLDMALIWSEEPAVISAMFTTNAAAAAPVAVTRQVAKAGRSQGIVVNSGNANAMTGQQGMNDAWAMQALVAEEMGVPASWVAVASTGVIGVPLPMDKIQKGIRRLGEMWRNGEKGDGQAASEAILTTDTVPKTLAAEIDLAGGPVRLGMMAKGSGMIHPDMATMLVFITTDVMVEKEELDELLHDAVDRSFHRLSVDGDQSTNDMVVVLANGMSRVGFAADSDRVRFREALRALTREGARMIARDGEGASHLLTVRVVGAVDEKDAVKKARAAVRSSLVKSAVYGQDPNWGRVIAAVGSVGYPFDPGRVSLTMNGMTLLVSGQPVPFDEGKARECMGEDEVVFIVDLADGNAEAEAFGCDLTERYVDINAHYRT